MCSLIFQMPSSIRYFFPFSRHYLNKATHRHLLRIVLALLFLRGKRTYATRSRLYLESRQKSNSSRCLNHSIFPGFFLLTPLRERVVSDAVLLPPQSPQVYLIIDSTYHKKQGKKMENRIIYKKGYSSTHFFLLGMRSFPKRGMRMPLPRRLYRTKEYGQKHGYKYRSPGKLWEQMIRYAKRPAHLEVVVLFDSFFPSESVLQGIRRSGYQVVCSLPCSRVDAETRENLHCIGRRHRQ